MLQRHGAKLNFEEIDAESLIVEAFYAELISDKALVDDPDIDAFYEDTCPTHVHMMLESTIRFSASADNEQVMHGHVHLEDTELELNVEGDDQHVIDEDDTCAHVVRRCRSRA